MEIKILNDRGIPTGIEFYSHRLRSDLLYRNQYIEAVCRRIDARKTDCALVHQQCEELHYLMDFFSTEEWPGLYAQFIRLNNVLGALVIAELKEKNAG